MRSVSITYTQRSLQAVGFIRRDTVPTGEIMKAVLSLLKEDWPVDGREFQTGPFILQKYFYILYKNVSADKCGLGY